MIQKSSAELSVRRQCELLHINHSSLYKKTVVPDEAKRFLREELMARLDYWHTTLPALGSRKLAVKLQSEGYDVGRKLVRRLMLEMGMWAIYPKPNLSKRNFRESIVPYLLRNKVVSFPNQVWSINITYIKLDRRLSQGQIGAVSAPICAFYRHSFGEFSIVSVQSCPIFSCSGSKMGQRKF